MYLTYFICGLEVFVHHTSIISMNKGCPVELNKVCCFYPMFYYL